MDGLRKQHPLPRGGSPPAGTAGPGAGPVPAAGKAKRGATRPRVLVPQQSVVQTLDVSSVWVIRPDSTAEYRKVTPGETFGGMWAIESGLEPGETVAVTGLQKLRQGMRVVPVKK